MSDQPNAEPAPAGDMPAATRAGGQPQDQRPATRDADAPMNDMQRITLQDLCRQAHVAFDDSLTTTEAARRISELQHAKDRDTEAARVARGAVAEDTPSDAGEEDPGAALDAPGTKQAIRGEEDATAADRPAPR